MTDAAAGITPAAEPADTPQVTAVLGGKQSRRTPPWLRWTLVVLFGLFFAFDVWEALGNLVGLSVNAAVIGTTLSATGWVVLVGALLAPVVCFVVALIVSRRMNVFATALVLLLALVASAVIALDVEFFYGTTFGSLLDLGA